MAVRLPADQFGNFTYTDNGTSIAITDYPTTEVGVVEIPALDLARIRNPALPLIGGGRVGGVGCGFMTYRMGFR